MKRPGLTESMRMALERMRDDADNCRLPNAMANKLFDLGLSNGHNITPSGQAALAAPRVTAAELDVLICGEMGRPVHTSLAKAYLSAWDKGWLESGMRFNAQRGGKTLRSIVHVRLSDAGTTALNNIRAASGSPEWKP